MMVGFVASNIAYDLLDAGVANLLGLETLRHGTHFFNNLNIRIKGGDPLHGGKESGSTQGWSVEDTRNYFYVFKDNEFQPPEYGVNGDGSWARFVVTCFHIKGIGSRFNCRYHSIVSSYNFVANAFTKKGSSSIFPELERKPSILIHLLASINGMVNFLFSPTLRFRFSKIEATRFEEDPSYQGQAYRTKSAVEPWRIGLLGSIFTGINFYWFSRVKTNPLKILTGIVQIISAIAITTLCIKSMVVCPVFAVAGVLLA